MEYSSTVWHPYTDVLTTKLDNIQRRAARFSLHRYTRESSVSTMIKELGWQTLEERRHLNCLTMFYKIHSNLVAIDITNYLEPKNHPVPTRTENTQAHCVPHSSRDYHRLPFFPTYAEGLEFT